MYKIGLYKQKSHGETMLFHLNQGSFTLKLNSQDKAKH